MSESHYEIIFCRGCIARGNPAAGASKSAGPAVGPGIATTEEGSVPAPELRGKLMHA